MTDLRRTIKCSNCGNESSITVSSDMEVKELLFSGKCRCGSSMQVTYNVVGQDSPAASAPSIESSADTVVNLDETLFAPEVPSDTLKDLMED